MSSLRNVGRYSGPTAAHAYHHVKGLERVKRVFILGPSHHFYLRCVRVRVCTRSIVLSMRSLVVLTARVCVSIASGCAVSTAVEYETPLGNIAIDSDVNKQLIATVRTDRQT